MWTGMGFRNLSNSKRAVTKLDDISGLKIRVMANPVALETWKTLGANAVPMAFAEVFTALEIKAIDGQENPLVHMYSNKMQEVQKYISLSNHVYTPVALVVSEKFWKGLSDADKAGIQKAADEAKLLQRQLLDEGDKDVIKKFGDAGVKVDAIPAAELAKIQEKVKPVVTKFARRSVKSSSKSSTPKSTRCALPSNAVCLPPWVAMTAQGISEPVFPTVRGTRSAATRSPDTRTWDAFSTSFLPASSSCSKPSWCS